MQKQVDLCDLKGLGQGFGAARAFDLQRGIVLAPAFFKGKAIDLLDRREAPGAGGAAQPFGVAGDQVGLHVALLHSAEIQTLPGHPLRQIAQIAPVGEQRIARRAQLGGLSIQESGNPLEVIIRCPHLLSPAR